MLELTPFLLFLLAGALAGTLAGTLGVGGGILYVPVLVFYLEYIGKESDRVPVTAVTTSLLVITISLLCGLYVHWKNGNVYVKSLPTLLCGGTFGALGASFVLVDTPTASFKIILGLLQVVIGSRLLRPAKTVESEIDEKEGEVSIIRYLPIGLGSGVISAFFGVGGGLIAVPLLHWAARFSMARAVGTSTCLVIINAFVSLSSYFSQGMARENSILAFVFLPAFLALVPSALIFARVGANFADKIDGPMLKRYFGVFVLIIGLMTVGESLRKLV